MERTREDGDVDFNNAGRREMREVAHHVDPALAIRRPRVVGSRIARHRRTRATLGTLPGIAVEEVRDRSARRARAVRVHRPGGWIRARD